MITCDRFGRIGNQFLMMCAAIGLAVKGGTDFLDPEQSINNDYFGTYFHDFPKLTRRDRIVHVHYEKSHNYTEIPFRNNTKLHGYFQSEKYFLHARKEILEAFKFNSTPISGVVGIHVRRGDYLTFPHKHPPVTIDYLKRATDYFKNKGYNKFCVFSDDLDWCKTNINFPECEFEYSEGKIPVDDMKYMSQLEHQIISNSTFSWVSAWMNLNPNKIVIAPRIWFGKGNLHLSQQDIVPREWIKM